MTAALRRPPVDVSPQGPCPAVARIAVFDDVESAEPVWRALEGGGAIMTAYQRYDWLAPWQHHVGAREGIVPLIVVGFDADDKPLFLWPLGRMRRGPLSIGSFLGGKHADFNFALWCPRAVNMGRAEIMDVFAHLGADHRMDLLALRNQPEAWHGVANPFRFFAHQASPSFGCRGALGPDFDAIAQARISSRQRRVMRKKEAALAALGPVRYWRVETVADADRVLDAFFAQKAVRMRELGIPNVFATPGIVDFIRAAATEHLESGAPAIELYAMSVGDAIVAVYGGAAADGRFSATFNSIAEGEYAEFSPGQLLFVNLARLACERGLHSIDLGVGEARYKSLICDEIEPLFDSFVALSPLGRLAAAAIGTAYDAKRRIKNTPALWKAFTSLRRFLNRLF